MSSCLHKKQMKVQIVETEKTLICSHLDKPIIGDDLYSLDAGKKSINICNFIWQINLKIIDIQ